ncbi:MAG: HIT family protein [Anaerolineae bacterium]|nr:HIT family protein [Anaerolineae bacterium]
MTNCIFCQIIRGEAPSWKVYEDEYTVAFLDIYPVNPYHTLVIPKTHHENIFDTPPEVLAQLMRTIKHVTTLYEEKLGIHNVQIINSSGAQAQQDVFHLHFHIIPRHAGDGQNVRWHTHAELWAEFDRMLTGLTEGESQ